MTIKQLKKRITICGRAIRKRFDLTFYDIRVTDIDLSVGEIFYAQGESRDVIMEEVNALSNKTGKVTSSCLLYYLDGAGVFNKRN